MQIFQPDGDCLKVAIIGTSGSGKTCFIAAMRWLGDCGTNARFISEGANGDSKNYLDDLHKKVNAGEVPPGTPKEFKLEFSERYASCEGKSPSQIDFSLRDFKGGDLPALDADSPLLQSWTQCDLLMVLLDIENVQKQGPELQDNLRDLSSVLMRKEMDAHQKRLAIVITQADKGGFSVERHSPEEAEGFLDENLPVFFNRIKECCFKETKCFLLASIGLEPEKGADGKSRVPEVKGKREWHPFGYEELFDWICTFQRQEEIERALKWFWVRAKPYVAVMVILIVGGVLWRGIVLHQERKALLRYEANSSWEETADATHKMSDNDRNKKIEERITNYQSRANSECDDQTLRNLLSDNQKFFGRAKLSEEQLGRVREIDSIITVRLEGVLVDQIKSAMKDNDKDSARNLIKQYRSDTVIAKNRLKEVDSYADDIRSGESENAKREIATYLVGDVGNTSRMSVMLEKISKFNYPMKADKEEAQKAVAAMRRLMQGGFTITQIRSEGLAKKRDTYVLIATGVASNKDLKDDGEEICVRTTIVDSVLPQWNDGRMVRKNLSWTPGQSIRVEWRRDAWNDKCIAHISVDGWIGLLQILQPRTEMANDGYGNFKEDPKITITCKDFPDPVKDLELIKRYVIPGTYWTEQ